MKSEKQRWGKIKIPSEGQVTDPGKEAGELVD